MTDYEFIKVLSIYLDNMKILLKKIGFINATMDLNDYIYIKNNVQYRVYLDNFYIVHITIDGLMHENTMKLAYDYLSIVFKAEIRKNKIYSLLNG